MKKRVVLLTIILLGLFTSTGWGQIINTFAGNGTGGHIGDGTPATAAELLSPSGVAVDTAGNLYIADQNDNRIRKVTVATGIISTIAGIGTTGAGGDGGAATDAQLYWPSGLTVDRFGNVYIADQFNDKVRKIDAFGIISTIAGTGSLGFSGDGGAATAAVMWHPVDVGVDFAGNVYALDQDNSTVRKIDVSSGIITTIAGMGDSAGYNGDNMPATASKLNYPQGICVDSAGNVWVADFYNSRVREIKAATGMITTVAGGGTSTLEGIPATAATFAYTSALARDHAGNLYINDCYQYRIRKVYTNGIVNTIAGNGTEGFSGDRGPATAAEMSLSEGLAVNNSGDVFLADFGNSVVRIITGISGTAHVLGVAGTEKGTDFKVFPNPSAGSFILQSEGVMGIVNVKVCNVMGKTIYQSAFSVLPANIDLVNAAEGVYFLTVESAGRTEIRKLLIKY